MLVFTCIPNNEEYDQEEKEENKEKGMWVRHL